MNAKASRNRTLTLSQSESEEYAQRLKVISQGTTISNIKNSTINQDIFEIIDMLPTQFADLIIIDPPYNLNKNFNDTRFKKMTDIQYIES